jgi:hypothetical protein
LSEFELSSYKFLHTLKLQINAIDDFIDKAGHEFLSKKLTDAQIEANKKKLLQNLTAIETDLKLEQDAFLQDILASYRKDLISLGYDLEEIRVNKLASRHGNYNKIAKKARKQVLAFPEQWHEKSRPLLQQTGCGCDNDRLQESCTEAGR